MNSHNKDVVALRATDKRWTAFWVKYSVISIAGIRAERAEHITENRKGGAEPPHPWPGEGNNRLALFSSLRFSTSCYLVKQHSTA